MNAIMEDIELKKKLQRLNELSTIIQIHRGQTLTREMKQEVENWEVKLQFRLNELVMKSKIEEADIKISIYEEVVKLLNKKE